MGDNASGIIISALSGMIGAVIGALLSSVIPFFLNKKATKAEIAEKYSSLLSGAIDHLGNLDEDAMHIRIGAIYELERLAEDSPRDRERIIKILTRFIENLYPSTPTKDAPAPPKDILVAVDVLQVLVRQKIECIAPRGLKLVWLKAKRKRYRLNPSSLPRPKDCCFDAMKVISHVPRKNIAWKKRKHFVNWENIKAAYVNLENINLTGANLLTAHLQGASLKFAFLDEAYLCFAHLEGAFLSCADMKKADLSDAKLQGAHFKFSGAEDGASLFETLLHRADLQHAIGLKKEQLDQAHMYETLLSPELDAQYKAAHTKNHAVAENKANDF